MIQTYGLGGGTPRNSSLFEAIKTPQAIALVLFVALSALDLCMPNISFAVLFSVPLLLLIARRSGLPQIWCYVTLFIGATYALYFVKYLIVYGHDFSTLWNFRLFNRTFAALMLGLLGLAAQAWLYWQHERSLLTHLDQTDEDEVNATAGLIGCIGLGLLIAAVDFVSPANFNLPILFVVPLYLVSWQYDQRSIWITAVVLVGLTWVGFFLTPPSTVPGIEPFVVANRTLVTSALFVMAGVLSWHVYRGQHDTGVSGAS